MKIDIHGYKDRVKNLEKQFDDLLLLVLKESVWCICRENSASDDMLTLEKKELEDKKI